MSIVQTPLAKVVCQYPVPAERVFAAWVDPGMIAQFLFGPRLREEEVIGIETDPRDGGHFSFVVRRGNQELNHTGRYLRVKRPVRLHFTWRVEVIGTDAPAPDSEVMLEFRDLPGGVSELTLLHELHPDYASFLPKVEEGWTRMTAVLRELFNEKR
jgi:uncharacterized protein YndB with AHSA1/START domain